MEHNLMNHAWGLRITACTAIGLTTAGCGAQIGPDQGTPVEVNVTKSISVRPGAGISPDCSPAAVLTSTATAPTTGPDPGTYAPASAPGSGTVVLTASGAEDLARSLRSTESGGPAPSASPITAIEGSYESYVQGYTISKDPRIAPSRCVWVVDVQASYVPKSPPGSAGPIKYPHYVVVLDAGTHALIDLLARN